MLTAFSHVIQSVDKELAAMAKVNGDSAMLLMFIVRNPASIPLEVSQIRGHGPNILYIHHVTEEAAKLMERE